MALSLSKKLPKPKTTKSSGRCSNLKGVCTYSKASTYIKQKLTELRRKINSQSYAGDFYVPLSHTIKDRKSGKQYQYAYVNPLNLIDI